MRKTDTSKGRITTSKALPDAAGFKPGDKVEFCSTPSGDIYVGRSGSKAQYLKKLKALAKRHPIRGITNEIMLELRGDRADDYKT